VNAQRVNIPSFLVEKDDVVTIKTKEPAQKKLRENLETSKDKTVPAWLDFSAQSMQAKVLRLPEKTDIQQPIEEQLIVELYSK
jgi:small subunit ribosomal protein S4